MGWYVGEEKIDSNYKFGKTTILSAKWEKKSSENKKTYTVTFIDYNCDCIDSIYKKEEVEEGKSITNPRSNIQWLLDGKEYDFNTPVTSDITLVAQNNQSIGEGRADKPLIYLYPEKEIDVEVKLGSIGNVTTIYPKYNDGWKVKAYPSGKLIDKNTGRELYGLYWEGKNYPTENSNEGFVVKGEDTTRFLEEKLEILGLTEREAEEFIIYWLPQMEHNKYNYIRFAKKESIDNYMPLEVNPKPDTVIRILMEFKPLEEKIEVKEQKLTKIERQGFTVVEWGGFEISGESVR